MQHLDPTDGTTPPADQAFARAIEAQAKAWLAARPDRRGTTDDGIPVVRRRRPKAHSREG
jgi:hypothetical protein